MGKRMWRSMIGMAALLAVSSGVQAAPLSFTGSFSVKLGTLPELVVGLAGVAVSNTPGSIVLGSNAVTTPTFVAPGVTAAPPITRLQMTGAANGAGTLNLSAPGQLGMFGRVRVEAYGGNIILVSVPFRAGPATPIGCAVPFGTGGTACPTLLYTTVTTRGLGLGGAPILKTGNGNIQYVTAGAWTAHTTTVVLPGATPAGDATTATPMTRTVMGADNRTAGGAGTVSFVAPIRMRTNVAANLSAFAELTLTFVPEPGTLVLLGGGDRAPHRERPPPAAAHALAVSVEQPIRR